MREFKVWFQGAVYLLAKDKEDAKARAKSKLESSNIELGCIDTVEASK